MGIFFTLHDFNFCIGTLKLESNIISAICMVHICSPNHTHSLAKYTALNQQMLIKNCQK